MELKDKVIWITGGNSGMGAASARLFVEKGAKVLITARREAEGNALADELGENCIFVKADSTVYEELAAAAKVAVDKWGRMDYLLSCAGGSEAGGFFVTEDDEQRAQLFKDMNFGLDLNIWGNFYASQIAATYMAKNEPTGEYGERGAITIIASMAADKIWFYAPPELNDSTWGTYGYGAAKAGLLGLVRDMGFVLGDFGIRVNAIKPGLILTPLIPDHEAGNELVKIINCFPKVGGTAEDVAMLAAQLFENEYINRESIAIDGGIIG